MRIVTHPGFNGFTIIILPTGEGQATIQINDSVYRDQLAQVVHGFFDEAGLGSPSSCLSELLNHWLTTRATEGDTLTPQAIIDMVGEVSRLQRFLAVAYEQSVRVEAITDQLHTS